MWRIRFVRVMIFAFVCMVASSIGDCEETVLYDAISDQTNFMNTGEGALNIVEGIETATLFDIGVGISIVGNGCDLNEISIVWQYGDAGGLNNGNYQDLTWRAAYYVDASTFTIEGLLGQIPTNQPDFQIDVAEPLPGYDDPIGNFEGLNFYIATVLVADLGWRTDPGMHGLVFLIPYFNDFQLNETNGFLSLIALSDHSGTVLGTTPDASHLTDGGADSAGPQTLLSTGVYCFDHSAGRVTTVSSLILGDVNLDGLTNLLDVAPFVELLTSGGFQLEADANQDGLVNLLDVAPFVEILAGG